METKIVEDETTLKLQHQYNTIHQSSSFFRDVMLIQEEIKSIHSDQQLELIQSLTEVRESHFREWVAKVQDAAKAELLKRQQQAIGITMRIDRLAKQYLQNKDDNDVRDRVISAWVQEGNRDA